MKKILVISPTPSHPQNAGNRARIHSLLSTLQEMKHDVYFLHINRELGDHTLMEKIWGDKFYSVPYQNSTIILSLIKRIVRKLKSFFKQDYLFTYLVDEWYDNSLDVFLAKLLKEIGFNVVIVEYVFFSKALKCFDDNVLKIIDAHDVFTDRHKVYLKNGQRPRWYSTTAKEEARGLSRADVIIAIQQKEQEFFSRLVNKEIITVGHIVPLYEPIQVVSSEKRRMLFVGSANPINIQGINYFIKDIFPRIKLVFPDVQLIVAGKVCDAMEDLDGCIKLGEFEDLKAVYDMADLVISPVLFGTGLKIKNIEALGYSKPLVTTSTGAEGLSDGIGKAFLVADTPREFATSVIEIFSDFKVFESLSKNAYDFVRRWNRENLRALENILS